MIMLLCPSLVSRKLQMNSNKEQEKTDSSSETLLMMRISSNQVTKDKIIFCFVQDSGSGNVNLISGKNEVNKLQTDKKKQFGPLVRWLKVNFAECFTAWIHVKVKKKSNIQIVFM